MISSGSCLRVVNIEQLLSFACVSRHATITSTERQRERQRQRQSVRQTQGTHVSLQSIGSAHLASGVFRRQPFCGPLSSSKVHMSHRPEGSLHYTLLEAHSTLPPFLQSPPPLKNYLCLVPLLFSLAFFYSFQKLMEFVQCNASAYTLTLIHSFTHLRM